MRAHFETDIRMHLTRLLIVYLREYLVLQSSGEKKREKEGGNC